MAELSIVLLGMALALLSVMVPVVVVAFVDPAAVDLALVVVTDVLNRPMGTVNRTIVLYQPVQPVLFEEE